MLKNFVWVKRTPTHGCALVCLLLTPKTNMLIERTALRSAASFALAFTLLGTMGCSAPSGTDDEDKTTSTASAVVGATDTGHPFAVGLCLGASGPGLCTSLCSGALIAPNLVMTARHCVDTAPNPVDCTKNRCSEQLSAAVFT
jgi:hypothetical protein